MKKFFVIGIIVVVLSIANAYASVIIEKEYVRQNSELATMQFEEDNSYQNLAYNIRTRDSLQDIRMLVYFSCLGIIGIYTGCQIYKVTKKE